MTLPLDPVNSSGLSEESGVTGPEARLAEAVRAQQGREQEAQARARQRLQEAASQVTLLIDEPLSSLERLAEALDRLEAVAAASPAPGPAPLISLAEGACEAAERCEQGASSFLESLSEGLQGRQARARAAQDFSLRGAALQASIAELEPALPRCEEWLDRLSEILEPLQLAAGAQEELRSLVREAEQARGRAAARLGELRCELSQAHAQAALQAAAEKRLREALEALETCLSELRVQGRAFREVLRGIADRCLKVREQGVLLAQESHAAARVAEEAARQAGRLKSLSQRQRGLLEGLKEELSSLGSAILECHEMATASAEELERAVSPGAPSFRRLDQSRQGLEHGSRRLAAHAAGAGTAAQSLEASMRDAVARVSRAGSVADEWGAAASAGLDVARKLASQASVVAARARELEEPARSLGSFAALLRARATALASGRASAELRLGAEALGAISGLLESQVRDLVSRGALLAQQGREASLQAELACRLMERDQALVRSVGASVSGFSHRRAALQERLRELRSCVSSLEARPPSGSIEPALARVESGIRDAASQLQSLRRPIEGIARILAGLSPET